MSVKHIEIYSISVDRFPITGWGMAEHMKMASSFHRTPLTTARTLIINSEQNSEWRMTLVTPLVLSPIPRNRKYKPFENASRHWARSNYFWISHSPRSLHEPIPRFLSLWLDWRGMITRQRQNYTVQMKTHLVVHITNMLSKAGGNVYNVPAISNPGTTLPIIPQDRDFSDCAPASP